MASEVTPAYLPMTPARAAAQADLHERAVSFEFAEGTRQLGPWVHAMVDAYYTIDTSKIPLEPPMDAKMRAFVLSACSDAAIIRHWRRHRVVYTLDADLARELLTTDPDDVIPAGLVRQLPHPNPYLALAEPVLVPIEARPNLVTQIKGVFLFGRTRERHLVSTADPKAATIGLFMIGDVIDIHGHPQKSSVLSIDGGDRTWSRTSLPMESMTIGEAMRQMYERFTQSAGVQGAGAPEAKTIIAAALGSIVPQVIYLCTENADTRPVPAVATRKRPDGSAYRGKSPKVVEFGYRVGPRLGQARKSYPVGAAGTTGRKMAPHVRRAHFHTYLTGPGRTVPTVRWLAPIPINVDSDAKKTTVVPGPRATLVQEV